MAGGALPEGLPSDLIQRRPDVLAAEARLRAAGARVDAARAAYIPRIALTGAVGHESTQLSQLMSGPSLLWNVVASITQPIWHGGRLSAQKEAVEAQKLQIELDYRDSVANAFREVRNAIAAVSETRSSVESGERRAQALQRAAELTRLRYKGGESSRLDVITICDRAYTLEAQRFSRVVLPCHVSSFGLGPSHTAIGSAIRLLAVTLASVAGKSALQRMDIIDGIHEELQDTET